MALLIDQSDSTSLSPGSARVNFLRAVSLLRLGAGYGFRTKMLKKLAKHCWRRSWQVFQPSPSLASCRGSSIGPGETRHLFRLPYGQTPRWEGPSSFPSDHAVLFFALATGIFLASRRTGWFVFAYVSIVICLPRIYLAEHYATDIFAGAAIGMFMTWLANTSRIRKPLTGWALRSIETRPGLFYSCLFIVTYQMAELFDPVLKMLKVAKSIIQGKPL